jgi:hypothetical protein
MIVVDGSYAESSQSSFHVFELGDFENESKATISKILLDAMSGQLERVLLGICNGSIIMCQKCNGTAKFSVYYIVLIYVKNKGHIRKPAL